MAAASSIQRAFQRINLLRRHQTLPLTIIPKKNPPHRTFRTVPSPPPLRTGTTADRHDRLAAAARFPTARPFSSAEEAAGVETEGGGSVGGSEWRALPTRHSRHHVPQVAPEGSLGGLGARILDAVPGTLFVYEAKDLNLTKSEEYENGLAKSYETQQMVEYILRGYNATFPDSLVQTTQPDTITDDRWKQHRGESDVKRYEETLEKMIALVERMELEGSVYVELRSKFRSQLVRPTDDTTTNPTDETTTTTTPEQKEAETMRRLTDTYGAPPGPSTPMYDLVLDAISVTLPHLPPTSALAWIRRASDLSSTARDRHDLDLLADVPPGTNPDSLPSPLTFNAVVRAAAGARYEEGNEELRDVALTAAFECYDAMHHHGVVERNSATYRYILEAVGKYLPVGPSKGNIAHGLWVKACVEERVLDEGVVDALMNHVRTFEGGGGEVDSLGMDFDNWIEEKVKVTFDTSKNGYGFPLKWSSKKKTKRYDKRFAAY